MKLDLENLPSDISLLHDLVRDLVSALKNRNGQIDQLVEQLIILRRSHFGRKSERDVPEQLQLFSQLLAKALENPPDEKPSEEPEKPTKRNGRKKFPKHLPRERKEHPLPADDRQCTGCGQDLIVIGEETSEQIEWIPASFVVHQHVRFKYACKDCQDHVITSEAPPKPIEKGMAGPGLLSHVITSKYCDHLPLARQERIYKRYGVDLSRKTLCDMVARCAELLEPIQKFMKKEVFQSHVVRSDDTPILVKAKGKCDKGYIWTYIGGPTRKTSHIVYDFTTNRSRAGPLNFVPDEYKGYFQADAYSAYDQLYNSRDVTEVGCWAHARRKFFDAREVGFEEADTAIEWIRALYMVEREAKEKELEPDSVCALRGQKSTPILEELKKWMEAQTLIALPKSTLAKAVQYALRQWGALIEYINDGHLDIDNNWAERELRRVVIGRKNWMFAGSEEGGKRAATLYSLVASCRHHDIDPFEYFRDVLGRIATHPMNQIRALVPAYWAPPSQPTPILGNLDAVNV